MMISLPSLYFLKYTLLSIAIRLGSRYKVVTSLCAICLSSYRLCTHVYVRVMVACDVSVRECAFSRMVAGDESVLAPSALCAGGLTPAGIPVADSLLAMFFIAESATCILAGVSPPAQSALGARTDSSPAAI